MPNVGAVIREEITRLSRRETRSQVETDEEGDRTASPRDRRH